MNLLLALISLLLTLLGLEVAVRFGARLHAPNWADKQQQFIDAVSLPFSYGIVRSHVSIPDLRVYFPSGALQPEPVAVRTNQFGMRMREVEIKKPDGAIRIAALGDSCTFGWMIPEESAYPRVLENQLNANGAIRYEILNFGVPGYTSVHGRLQYNRLVKSFQPDLLILAYGFNDSYDFRFSEGEFLQRLQELNLTQGLHGFPLFLYDCSALSRWFIRRIYAHRNYPIEVELHQRAAAKSWSPRVERASYEANMRAMIQDAQTDGGQAIVVNLDLPNTWVRKPAREIANQTGAEFLDAQELFENQSQPDPRVEAIQSSLQKPGEIVQENRRKPWLVFRVFVPDEPAPKTGVYLLLNAGRSPWPWQTPMFDDGSKGDERADDRVWTAQVELDLRELVDYSFINGRLSDTPPFYENSDKALRFYYHVDLTDVKNETVWTSPIHTLNRIPFEHLMVAGDVIHPNAAGHRLIAETLAPLVQKAVEKQRPSGSGARN